jgi:hypothetical protein
MYLPDEINKAHVLITVKTYPLPNTSYGETVCTAGLLEDGKWVRIYPVSWQLLRDDQKYPKYSWIELDLRRHPSDYRQETYRPRLGFDEDIKLIDKLGTADAWAARKQYVFREVFTSMQELIALTKGSSPKSLATLKPTNIIDFRIEEEGDKQWKKQWLDKLKQTNMFDMDASGQVEQRRIVRKMPYKFKYRFLSEGDKNPRELSIQDWEIGALFWHCLNRTRGDDEEAKRLVKQKYFDEFVNQKDIYLFLGTNYKYQRMNSPDPFIIVGVFYPPVSDQLPLPLKY